MHDLTDVEAPPPRQRRPRGSRTPLRLINGKRSALIVLVIVFALYPMLGTSVFWLNIGVLAFVYAIAGVGWNILGGFTGQVSFGHAAFFGVGGYAMALSLRADLVPWVGFVIGIAVSAGLALIVGLPTLRLRSHYFAIATIGIGTACYQVANGLGVLGASSGLQIPIHDEGLTWLLFSASNPTGYYYLAALAFLVAVGCAWAILRSRTGRYWQAIRDDEHAADAVGVPLFRYKVLSAVLSAGITALAGCVYALYSLFVDPTSMFDIQVSVMIVLVAVLGGIRSIWGALIGAWILIAIEQVTQSVAAEAGGGLELLVYGGLVVLVMMVEPTGIVGIGHRIAGSFRARHGSKTAPQEVGVGNHD